MPVVIGSKPESDFTDPIGMLGDCHRRIERFLNVLLQLAGELRGGEMSDGQRSAFENALRYFREAAPKHTADEEDSLFPRLRAKNDPRLASLLAQVEALEADHGRAETMHAEVDRLGGNWLTNKALPESEAARLVAALTELSGLYQRHIRIEDTEVFPAAAGELTPEERRAVGREMRQRRALP